MTEHNAAKHEPDPIPNRHPAVWEVVVQDMQQRDAMGRAKYGTPLQPFNGRDALWDAYQEALDLAVYIRQAILENNVPNVTKLIIERDAMAETLAWYADPGHYDERGVAYTDDGEDRGLLARETLGVKYD